MIGSSLSNAMSSRVLRVKSMADLPENIRRLAAHATSPVRPSPVIEKPKGKPRGRTSKLELEHEQHLEWTLREGILASYKHHGITLLLGEDCRYTPDYVLCWRDDPIIELREVKGPHAWEDSIVKLKTAATIFPYFRFTITRKVDHGQWQVKRIEPA